MVNEVTLDALIVFVKFLMEDKVDKCRNGVWCLGSADCDDFSNCGPPSRFRVFDIVGTAGTTESFDLENFLRNGFALHRLLVLGGRNRDCSRENDENEETQISCHFEQVNL